MSRKLQQCSLQKSLVDKLRSFSAMCHALITARVYQMFRSFEGYKGTRCGRFT